MSEYVLEMTGVSKSFPGVKALDNVQLRLRPGKVHALMGENGAGKSTLMKCMFGIYKMDAGQILMDGQPVTINDPMDALSKYGDKVEVVFCNNDGMALGAQTAIEAAGRKVGEDIYLVGVDALPEAIDLIKEGNMTGTVLNDHIGQSHAAVDVAVKLLNGEAIENYYWVNYVKVDKAYAEANY